ncbi:MAG: metal-dependent hydrolase [Thermodesulfobacteriota bacterium]
MPTVITHAVVGVGAGIIVQGTDMSARFWTLSVVCSILPDADVLAFRLGIPYSHWLGHRGFFHSVVFALIKGPVVTSVFFSGLGMFSEKWWRLAVYFSLLGASHGLLDACTNGGLGIALLSPFTNHRYFFWFTPIEVAPLGVRAFLSEWGLAVMMSEFLWVWLPLGLAAVFCRWALELRLLPRV